MPPTAGNPLFIKWITDWANEFEAANNRNMAFCFKRALRELKLVTEALPVDRLSSVKGIGETIVKKVERKLKDYLDTGGTLDQVYGSAGVPVATKDAASSSSQPPPAKKARNAAAPKPYIPAIRSGPYGILVALHKLRDEDGVTKSRLQSAAQPYCDTSYKDATNGPYSAWSSMKTLITKGMVDKSGNPPIFDLTEPGMELANSLCETMEKPGAASASSLSTAPSVNIYEQFNSKIKTSADRRQSLIMAQSKAPAEKVFPFQFWYLDECNSRVKSKDRAHISFSDEGNTGYTVEFHKCQSKHPMAGFCFDVATTPDDSGMIKSSLIDSMAPDKCPQISIEFLASALSSNTAPSVSTQNQKPTENEEPRKPPKVVKPPPTSAVQVSLNKSPVKIPRLAPQRPADPTSPIHITTKCMWPEASPVEPTTRFDFDADAKYYNPDEFEIVLILDNREIRANKDRQFIQTELHNRGVLSETRVLDVGDILWIARRKSNFAQQQARTDVDFEVVLDFIIERKRLDDFVSSIMSGRFREQKSRLRSCGLEHIYYLVEDFTNASVEDFGREKLRVAMASLNILDGMNVKRTANLVDSIKLLASLTQLIISQYEKNRIYALPDVAEDKPTLTMYKKQLEQRKGRKYHFTYNSFMSMNSKTKNLTLKEIWFRQLMCVRGISPEKAETFVQAFPTPASFFEKMSSLSTDKERQDCIKNLSRDVSRHNFGQALCKKIVNFFTQMEYNDTAAQE